MGNRHTGAGEVSILESVDRDEVTHPAPDLCIVLPVLNEHDNIATLVGRLRSGLAGIACHQAWWAAGVAGAAMSLVRN